MNNEFHTGGVIPLGSNTYVVREADRDFYENLKRGKFCYVLNSRQMGKSSLRLRTSNKLRNEGIFCVDIDITPLCGFGTSEDQFYAGFLHMLLKELKSQLGSNKDREINLGTWWKEHERLPVLMKIQTFIENEILEKIAKKIIIFIDEIDRIIDLEFKDNFFAFIRFCYNQRAKNPKYNNLTFALLGVATPSDLIADNTRTPFNIESKAIELSGFKLDETEPLENNLVNKVNEPRKILEEILRWTNGQPFLTHLICQYVTEDRSPFKNHYPSHFIDKLISDRIIGNWIEQDYQDHFTTIYSRLVDNKPHNDSLIILKCYRQILQGSEIEFEKERFAHVQLLLSGLVVKKRGKLKIFNRIYQEIFNINWLKKELNKISDDDDRETIEDMTIFLTELDIIEKIPHLSREEFDRVCKDILIGLGFSKGRNYSSRGLEISFTDTLIRESTDKMFRTEETWLIFFGRWRDSFDRENVIENYISLILQEAQKVKVENLLTIFFGEIPAEIISEYHNTAKRSKIKSVIISDIFSADLVNDYSAETLGTIKNPRLSFKKLRQRMEQQSKEATWRTQF